MILFMNEEGAYRYWVARHRDGFVLDGRHRPRWAQLTLHRSTCPHVAHSATKRTRWTTGTRFKACSLNRQEIVEWVSHELGRPWQTCLDCLPETESPPAVNGNSHLTRLAAGILDHVLEVTAIHLDADSAQYQLTIGEIAECMGKSPAQVAAAFRRLFDDGFLASDDCSTKESHLKPRQLVYPTASALRKLPYFAEWTNERLETQIDQLRGGVIDQSYAKRG